MTALGYVVGGCFLTIITALVMIALWPEREP